MSGETEGRRRGRPRTIDRGSVLSGAMQLYWREGVHALSLNEVCRRLSVSKPFVYREFDDEDGFVVAVLALYRERVVVPVLDALVTEQACAEVVEMLIAGLTAPGEHPPGCLFTEMRLIRTTLGPRALACLESIEDERRRAFAAWYARAQYNGEVSESVPPDEAASYIDNQFTLVLIQMGMGAPADLVRAHARRAMSALGAA